jgi:alkylation response protein AidB-like acyl-CoA dehydrogenase
MLGISDDHIALHDVARRWVAQHCPPSVARSHLDADADALPPFWNDLAEVGWLGLHLPEDVGGSGYGLAELAVVVEELGRACAPGPFLSTVIASAVIDACGTDGLRAELLPGLADGSVIGGVAIDGELVLGGQLADIVVESTDGTWAVHRQPQLTSCKSVDLTRRVARLVGSPEPLGGRDTGAMGLIAAECAGGAAWCVDTAAEHARVREQFGRPIGQFQGVKHRCADMLVALEQARAVAWDAVRPGGSSPRLAATIAAAIAPDAFLKCAKDCIQVLGGIGFTWEHDAHLYLKRAMSLVALTGGDRTWAPRVTKLARAGERRSLDLDLPSEAEPIRATVRAELAEVAAHDKSEWRGLLADKGFIAPHWPKPWGRDASALEQLVIDEEMRHAHVRRPHLQIGAWVLPTLIEHGTPEQQQRFIPPTLRGELPWCQLFSEPGAGSDLASLSMKASKVDGGWLLTGQKVWTSFAREAEWGLCLARTDPTVPKHEGITCFLVDMASDGIDIRPLRELTGFEMFNEVFLTDAFVPDDCVVGAPGDGWRAGRTTLANERVSMGSGSSFGFGVQMLLGLVEERDAVAAAEVGALLAEAHSLAVMGLRTTARAVSGADPGPESSVRKLLNAEHDQNVQELGMRLHGWQALADDGDAATWIAGFLANRCLTIAGGTSEVQRNVIAERLLGLPKDP